MARVLLVEDDENQLLIRRLLFEKRGYDVLTARNSAEALQLASSFPDLALIDLSIPRPEDGLALVRELHVRLPQAKIAVLTGLPRGLEGTPEASMVEAVFEKSRPVRAMLEAVAKLLACLLLWLPIAAKDFPFDSSGGEMIAELDLSSPASDWAKSGSECAVARVLIDGQLNQHVLVFAERRDSVKIFLGAVARGSHKLTVERDERYSAAGSNLEIRKASFRNESSDLIANAPILFARTDTIGKFSDVPLLMYVERLPAGLQYTVVFSNEDGGHSTRGLLARWGRTTDIEYIYRLEQANGFIQTRDHQDVPFDGEKEGRHPLLIPVTKNNMVGPLLQDTAGRGELRFQLVPIEIELKDHSRETVMDRNPWTYAVASKELIREGRLPEIGDPRNYLYIEASIRNANSRLAFKAKSVVDTDWRRSDRGDQRLAVERSGWVRMAIEMAPGTSPKQVTAFALECLPEGGKPICSAERVSAFFLTPDYVPGRVFKPSLK